MSLAARSKCIQGMRLSLISRGLNSLFPIIQKGVLVDPSSQKAVGTERQNLTLVTSYHLVRNSAIAIPDSPATA